MTVTKSINHQVLHPLMTHHLFSLYHLMTRTTTTTMRTTNAFLQASMYVISSTVIKRWLRTKPRGPVPAAQTKSYLLNPFLVCAMCIKHSIRTSDDGSALRMRSNSECLMQATPKKVYGEHLQSGTLSQVLMPRQRRRERWGRERGRPVTNSIFSNFALSSLLCNSIDSISCNSINSIVM